MILRNGCKKFTNMHGVILLITEWSPYRCVNIKSRIELNRYTGRETGTEPLLRENSEMFSCLLGERIYFCRNSVSRVTDK